MNWIAANRKPKRPIHHAACTKSPPVNCRTSPGNTGMITPKANTSISTVMKMKINAARRLPEDGTAFKGKPGNGGGAV